jgi:hypothetical protein
MIFIRSSRFIVAHYRCRGDDSCAADVPQLKIIFQPDRIRKPAIEIKAMALRAPDKLRPRSTWDLSPPSSPSRDRTLGSIGVLSNPPPL